MKFDSKSMLEAVFESIADGILIVDNAGKVLHSNSRFQEMWKIPEELIHTGDDKRLINFILDQLIFPEEFARKVQDLYLLPEAVSEDTIAFKDGRFFARQSRPLRIDSKILGRVWTFLDISTEKKSEEAFKAIMNLSPDIISILSPEGLIVYNSPASEKIHGYPRDSMLGKSTFEFIHPEDQELCTQAMSDLMSKPEAVVSVEYRYKNIRGGYDWMEARASNQIQNALINGIVVISREIGKTKQMREGLQHALSNLENFISIASHELKTPVTGIKLQLQMLQRQTQTETGKRSGDMNALIRQVNSLERLIDDLLQVSRIRRGKLLFEMHEENFSEILKENIQRFESILASSECELKSLIEPSLMVNCDRLRMEQVLINLISNIVRYAPGKPVEMKLEKSGNFLELRVKDHGPGIDPAKYHQIFLPFASEPDKKCPGGLGVGLYISKTIVEQHEGELKIEKSSAEGTTFLLKLPLS